MPGFGWTTAGLAFPGSVQYPTVGAVFNPQRYYAETGQSARNVPNAPGGTVSPGGAISGTMWIFILLAIFAIWALERRRLGLSLDVRGKA